jgi:hypothetical protein
MAGCVVAARSYLRPVVVRFLAWRPGSGAWKWSLVISARCRQPTLWSDYVAISTCYRPLIDMHDRHPVLDVAIATSRMYMRFKAVSG